MEQPRVEKLDRAKLVALEKFNGTKGTLKSFLTTIDIYYYFY